MPVPIRILTEAAKPLRQRIEEFLRGDRENAYALEEVYSNVEGVDEHRVAIVLRLLEEGRADERLAAYRTVLDQLVGETLVAAVPYEGDLYYHWAGPRLPTRGDRW